MRLTEQIIREILGPYVDAVDHVAGREWCVWIEGMGNPVSTITALRALRDSTEDEEGMP